MHRRYKPKDPATFKIGDIIEVKVSFVIIPSRGGGHAMQVMLRGLTLLDNSFSKVREINHTDAVSDSRTRSSHASKG